MVNESVKNAYETNQFMSLFQSLQEDFPASSADKDGEEPLPTAARCYRFDDSDDDNACKDESMVSLMKFLNDTILRIRAKLQFSSLSKEEPVLSILLFFPDQDHRSLDVESAALHTFSGYISSDTDEVRSDEATTVSLSLKTPLA